MWCPVVGLKGFVDDFWLIAASIHLFSGYLFTFKERGNGVLVHRAMLDRTSRADQAKNVDEKLTAQELLSTFQKKLFADPARLSISACVRKPRKFLSTVDWSLNVSPHLWAKDPFEF